MAVIRHTWDPAAQSLLRFWAKDTQCPLQAEAGATLAELEARIARQGTLVRPASETPENLLRPAAVGTVQADNLVRSADTPVAVAEHLQGTSAPMEDAIQVAHQG
jgi:hypothetical protein